MQAVYQKALEASRQHAAGKAMKTAGLAVQEGMKTDEGTEADCRYVQC
jgi:hypothetical protein